ncbi:MAG: RNA polymerase sigma factor [Planctomycetota bacterium]
MTDTPNPLLSDSASDWERLIESVDPASLLLVIDRRMTAALKKVVTAEDILQESLLHAWRDRKKFQWQGTRSFRSWLLTIADHRIQDNADRAGADKRGGGRVDLSLAAFGDRNGSTTSEGQALPAGSTTPSRLAVYREQAEVMRAALDGLPEEFRDVVRLRLFEHCALEEIAERLQIGASAVRHRFRKGSELYLGRLRSALGSQSRLASPESAADLRADSSPSEGMPNEA